MTDGDEALAEAGHTRLRRLATADEHESDPAIGEGLLSEILSGHRRHVFALIFEAKPAGVVPQHPMAGEVHDVWVQFGDEVAQLVERTGFGNVEVHASPEPVSETEHGVLFLLVIEASLAERRAGGEEDAQGASHGGQHGRRELGAQGPADRPAAVGHQESVIGPCQEFPRKVQAGGVVRDDQQPAVERLGRAQQRDEEGGDGARKPAGLGDGKWNLGGSFAGCGLWCRSSRRDASRCRSWGERGTAILHFLAAFLPSIRWRCLCGDIRFPTILGVYTGRVELKAGPLRVLPLPQFFKLPADGGLFPLRRQ